MRQRRGSGACSTRGECRSSSTLVIVSEALPK